MKSIQFFSNASSLGAKSIFFLGACAISFATPLSASVGGGAETTTVIYLNTPLCVAISKGEVDVVKKFIEYGADVNERSNGMTPLMLAARYNNVDIIKCLLAHGANVKAKDDKGFTALKHAELSNASDAVAYLKSI